MKTLDYGTFLQSVKDSRILMGLSRNAYKIIFESLTPGYHEFGKNELIIREGDIFDAVGIVIHGKIAGKRLDYEGNASLEQILVPPSSFGFEIAATPSQVSPIYLKCLEQTTVLIIPYKKLLACSKLLDADKITILENLSQLLANDNIRKLYKIELLTQKSMRKRILMYLNFMSDRAGSQSFEIPFNRNQLAQYLNLNRSALSAELAQMKKENLIDYHKNNFTLKLL
jgi:CRP-like cAMP-binding protein